MVVEPFAELSVLASRGPSALREGPPEEQPCHVGRPAIIAIWLDAAMRSYDFAPLSDIEGGRCASTGEGLRNPGIDRLPSTGLSSGPSRQVHAQHLSSQSSS